ncbi:MAG: hypothetical protein EFT35_05485 [Methanophagales archaeon ANME-1-THS]|nr:MAG: hypothetical protein EFT35_05485 [Methanophagales archaeon ANME-1-THS]
MAKRSYSLHPTTIERIKYLAAGVILLVIALAVVAADTEYPQLEPVRKLTNTCTGGIVSVYSENPHLEPVRNLTTSCERTLTSAYHDTPHLKPLRKLIQTLKGETVWLSIGETGETDGLAVTLVKGALNDGYSYNTWSGSAIEPAPSGAKFLFLYIKIENIGKVKERFPCSSTDRFFGGNEIGLYYADTKMPPHQIKPSPDYTPLYSVRYGDERYPGLSEEGWIAFEVPAGIELDETTFKIRDVGWHLAKEKIEHH